MIEFDRNRYRMDFGNRVADQIRSSGLAPVIFAGAGLSKRYMNAPTWEQILDLVLVRINSQVPVSFYLQRAGNIIDCAQIISDEVHRWAWTTGRGAFNEDLFKATRNHNDFMKELIARELRKLSEVRAWESAPKALQDEILALLSIKEKVVITTNYDTFFEDVSHTKAVFGKDTLLNDFQETNLLLKIHGCRTDPSSIVLLPRDYDGISIRHKYISAKLLTYFAERVVFFFGYSLYDPDIRNLFVDAATSLGRIG